MTNSKGDSCKTTKNAVIPECLYRESRFFRRKVKDWIPRQDAWRGMTIFATVPKGFRLGLGMWFLLGLCLQVGAPGLAVTLPTGVDEERFTTEVSWKKMMLDKSQARPRVVLVLGGGGARGLAHIGVLRVLEEERIPVDEIVGVSVGALIGALYASGLSVSDIELMAKEIGWNKLSDYSKMALFKLVFSDELLSTERMEKYLDQHIGAKTFSDLRIPFACVATDIRTGEPVFFREGSVALAARASATIPAVFKPVEYRQRLLIDGGLVNNLPTDMVSSSRNGDIIVAVLPRPDLKSYDESTVFKALVRSIEIQKEYITAGRKQTSDLLIEPDTSDVSLADLSKSKVCIEAGVLAARQKVLLLKQMILARIAERKPGGER